MHAPLPERSRMAALEAAARVVRTQEAAIFSASRPRAKALHEASGAGFLAGLPLHWMSDWPTPFPVVVEAASEATITDIDGLSLVDLCLGDTGAMFGHGPRPILAAMAKAAQRGLTTMLPSADAAAVGRLLAARFGLPHWQVATSASDANRFAIRVARAVTGRRKVLVFDGCYHGAVDDTLVDLVAGKTVPRANLLGQAADLGETTVAVPFNDIVALRAALATGDIACIIAEPVMTNCGMILPDPGFHAAMRQAATEAGALLHIDETHTISTGLGGYTAVHGLQPDIFAVGKPIGGGVPVAVWGMTDAVAERLAKVRDGQDGKGHSGIGTTLSGSAFQLLCLRACLEEVMTAEAYATMMARADQIEDGFRDAISAAGLPWLVSRVGARLEVIFSTTPVRNAEEARAAASWEIEAAIHLALLNRGYLLTPFHNMVLVCPSLSEAQAAGLVTAYGETLGRIIGQTRAA